MSPSAPSTEDLLPLAEGRYRLTETLGAGGMATVFKALDTRLRVTRAIKVLNPAMARSTSLRARFVAEARTMALLEHRNIVRVYDVGSDGDRVYIVMEYLEGGSLVDRLEAHGPIPLRQALDITVDILAALEIAHSNGVVHRDIKPHNVLLTSRAEVRVSDFGIAHVRELEDDHLTKTGTAMGTWGFMAPEQRSNARGVDGRADIYATGATLYTCVVNEAPMDLFAADLDPKMLGAVHSELAAVIRKATRYDRHERYASAPEMAAALAELRERLPPLPEDAPPLARAAGSASPPPSLLSALRPSTSGPGLHPVRKPGEMELVGPVALDGPAPTQIPLDSLGALAEPGAEQIISVSHQEPERLARKASETVLFPGEAVERPRVRIWPFLTGLSLTLGLVGGVWALTRDRAPGWKEIPSSAPERSSPESPVTAPDPTSEPPASAVEPMVTPPVQEIPTPVASSPRPARGEQRPPEPTPTVAPAEPAAVPVSVTSIPAPAAPALEHSAIRQARVGETLSVNCRVTGGRYKAYLYYRPTGKAAAYTRRLMSGEGSSFSASVMVTQDYSGGLDYHISALSEDSSLPELKKGTGFQPIRVAVTP